MCSRYREKCLDWEEASASPEAVSLNCQPPQTQALSVNLKRDDKPQKAGQANQQEFPSRFAKGVPASADNGPPFTPPGSKTKSSPSPPSRSPFPGQPVRHKWNTS